MSHANHDQLPTIDPAALAQISGGAVSSTTSSDDQVLTALTGILESIQSLATQPRSGGFNQQEMMMLVMMMQQRNQQAAAAATAVSPWSQEPIVRYY